MDGMGHTGERCNLNEDTLTPVVRAEAGLADRTSLFGAVVRVEAGRPSADASSRGPVAGLA